MPRVQQKRGTAANLTSVDPTPLAGELLVVSDENSLKIGNGTDSYTSLSYVTATPRDGSVTTAKIADDAVTYAKLQNVSATDRLLGRSSSGAGDVQEITCTAFGRSLIDDADAAAGRATLAAAPLASPTFTGVVTVAAGTAALPAMVPSGDANTGILFPAADTVAISTGGSERVRFKDNGVLRYVPIATEPSTAESGDVYYHSGLRRMRMYNGFRWQSLAVSGQEWNVSAASFVRSFSVATQEATPQGVFFKPDGTKMYIVGISSSPRSVREYSLTIAWDISTAAHSQSFAVNNEDTSPTSVFFRPDGTKMYVAGDTGNDINEYTLSTAWDISTATFVQAYVINSQEANIAGIFFRDDGVKMYMTGVASDNVNEYTLSTAWDVSTAAFVQAFSVAGQETGPHGLFFKPDGRRMYIVGSVGDDVTEYALSTAWDISTATHTTERSVSAQDNDPRCVFFRPDGLMMYIAGNQNDSVYQYTLQ